jgi:hypothetical protein
LEGIVKPQEHVNPLNSASSGRLPDSRPTLNAARTAAAICLILGCWFFVSPWVYGASRASSWNCWVTGAFIIFFSCFRVGKPAYSTGLSWLVMIAGGWAAASPWTYNYVGDVPRFLNSLILGIIIFVLSIFSARMSMRSNIAGMAQVQ